MKHKGALMEYFGERSDDLMRAYDEYIESCGYIRMTDVYGTIVNMPSRRFWVSDIRAALVVSAMMKGKANLKKMCPSKREMYEEIYRRVMVMYADYPDKTVSELCAMVVMQPAPKFYLTPGSAKIMVCKARKIRNNERKERICLLYTSPSPRD